jgi:predicted tellurium resistance membrane protein TerC
VLRFSQAREDPLEYFSIEFLSALAAIVVIDLALAGDNAIVIALAARGFRRTCNGGRSSPAAGALVVRSTMTLVVVWLLGSGLLGIGGALLIWIAYRLLRPEDEPEHAAARKTDADGFWGAMRTSSSPTR